ncbi:MAG: Ig-like domain-containing protein, partial [Acidobacteriota bacterium]
MRSTRALSLLFLAWVLCSSVATAGTISIAWNPVSDPDVAGYRVYYGTLPGIYTQNKDVGNVTETTLTDLAACVRYHIAVKAYDTGGLESVDYSNEVVGLPRPIVSSVQPNQLEQGSAATLRILGESYDDGASVEISGSGVTVSAVRRVSCTELEADVEAAFDAAPGPRDVTVLNPDNSFGTLNGGLTVVANPAPFVSSTDPAAGATDVAVTIQPRVVFSEPMAGATITPANVRLLDANDQPVAQAANSPQLSTDGVTATIIPASELAHESTYRI